LSPGGIEGAYAFMAAQIVGLKLAVVHVREPSPEGIICGQGHSPSRPPFFGTWQLHGGRILAVDRSFPLRLAAG